MDKAYLDWLVKLLMILVTFEPRVIAPPVRSTDEALTFLQQFGYIRATEDPSLFSMTEIKDPILLYQSFMGLNETGELDNETLTMMNEPRCGVEDDVHDSGFGRSKRYATEGIKWISNNITYRISKYPTRIRDRRKVDKEIARAFRVWQHETPLIFWPKEDGEVNIDIRFEEGFHGHRDSFDGPGFILAHASSPSVYAYVHFDDEEDWTIDEYFGPNLFQSAAHEFGHTLGLRHSRVKSSLMFPAYKREGPLVTLHEDDINGVQKIYGPWVLNMCADRSIDAVTTTADGTSYAFKGKYYWDLTVPRKNISQIGHPRLISDDWDGHPGNVDAVFTWANNMTYFLKGDKYWCFKNKTIVPRYPKLISKKFKGIPMNIDAAFGWRGKTYFFKDSTFWVYDNESTPRITSACPISDLGDIPDYIDAGAQFGNYRTYLIKGDVYYKLELWNFSIAHRYPRRMTYKIPSHTTFPIELPCD